MKQQNASIVRPISKIIVHCSDTYARMNTTAEDIRKWHTSPPRNWSDIGYHFVIKRNGEIERGRPLEIAGAHTRGHNSQSIGVCWVGGRGDDDKPQDNRTEEQKKSLANLLKALKHDFPNAEILGHRDVSGVKKACPSFDVKEWIKTALK